MAENEPPVHIRRAFVRALMSYRLSRGALPQAEALKPSWRALLRGYLTGTTREK